MKDLYKRLGVSPGVARAILTEAIDRNPDTSLKTAAREILLSEHRAEYDNAHAQLRRIGQLRANLGLAHATAWQQTNSSDFDVSARGHHSQLKALRDEIQHKQQTHTDGSLVPRRAWWDTSLRASAILIGLGMWIWYLLPANEPATESHVSRSFDATPDSATNQSTREIPATASSKADYEEVDLEQAKRNGSNAPAAVFGPSRPMPQTGVIFRAQRSKRTWPELRIRSGNRAGNFFVKVISDDTKQEAARLFVRSGEVATITLPPGDYRVRYASGSNWFGEGQYFGPETVVAEGVDAVELRAIKSATGYQLVGGELTLEKQVDGNFADREIAMEDF
jgi:hypothetical protein